ncbi:MAG: PAS domain S-box protein [Phycisphaerae bacterium]|jgi:PAS domain S-box-containing protein
MNERADTPATSTSVDGRASEASCRASTRASTCADAAAYLAAILESSDDAIIGVTLDGVIFDWSAGAARLLGYSAAEMAGRPAGAIFQPEGQRILEQLIAGLRDGQSAPRVETVCAGRNGRAIHVSLSASAIVAPSASVVGLAIVCRDLTGRRRSLGIKNEALARLRAVVETAVDGIITIDESGTIETINPAALRLFGWESCELIGKNVAVLMPEPHRSEHDSYLSNYLRTGVRKIIGIGREVRGRRKDGSEFPMELAVSETRLGNRRIFTGIVRDVSERHHAEQALRESEERFSAFMRHLPGAAWMKDLAGRYVYANPEAERVFGMRLADMRGKTDAQLFPPETARQFEDNDRRALREPGGFTNVEVLRQADGIDHRSIVSKFAVPGVGGRTAFVGGVAFDVTDRLLAEDALRQSESRYRHLVQCLPAAVYTCDMDGRITLYNAAAATLWGREPVAGQDRWCGSYRLYQGDGSPMAREDCPMSVACREGRSIRGAEILIERPDGSFANVLANPEPIVDASGKVVGAVNTLIDITSRKRMETTLRESESRFRLMADCAPNMIWMSGVDGGCTWFNRRWLEFTGRTAEQELGEGWTEGVHPDDLEHCLRTYRAAFAARQPFEMEYRLRRFDGEHRWLRDSGVPIRFEDGAFAGYIGSCVDVTDRKLGEDVLIARVAQRTRELSGANEQLQHQISERRRIESLLESENRVLELIAAGADREELLEELCRAVEELIPGSRCAIRLAPRRSRMDARSTPDASTATATGLDLFGAIGREGVHPPLIRERTIVSPVPADCDAALRAQAVRSYWIEPIVAQGDAIVGALGVYCDEPLVPDEHALAATAMATRLAAFVVERARAEEQVREQLAQLAHVSRVATMGEMASGLAHEINQPLCAIVNFTEACAELIQRSGRDREELPQALREVARQAERAGEVIRRLREFVKRRDPERKPVDINALVREVTAFTGVEARHREVRIRERLGRRMPKVYADGIQVQQVLVNLVRNACEAMQSMDGSPRTLTIETFRNRGAVEVTVSDTGPGIPRELEERIFEPFLSTKRDGMGMGLSISRSILEAHDGRLWATPNRGGGTTFHFTLPTAWRARRGRWHGLRSR